MEVQNGVAQFSWKPLSFPVPLFSVKLGRIDSISSSSRIDFLGWGPLPPPIYIQSCASPTMALSSHKYDCVLVVELRRNWRPSCRPWLHEKASIKNGFEWTTSDSTGVRAWWSSRGSWHGRHRVRPWRTWSLLLPLQRRPRLLRPPSR
jgi:hypothetical protein